jgi:hypothetical protein
MFYGSFQFLNYPSEISFLLLVNSRDPDEFGESFFQPVCSPQILPKGALFSPSSPQSAQIFAKFAGVRITRETLDLSGFLAKSPCGYWLFERVRSYTRILKTYIRLLKITYSITDSKSQRF